jgi:hypothetical protein
MKSLVLTLIGSSYAWLSHSSANRESSLILLATTGADMLAAKTVTKLTSVPNHVHRLVLMRHGESEFNNANIFTGWSDIGKIYGLWIIGERIGD